MMKKLFVMLSLVLCLGMYGCFNGTKTVDTPKEDTIVAVEEDAIFADTLVVDSLNMECTEVEEVEAEQVME